MELVNESGFTVGWCVGKVPPHPVSATLLVKGTFDLAPRAPAAPAPKQDPLDGDVEEEGAVRYPSDFAWFKPRADVLLVGTCHQPKGKPNAVCSVAFQVGKWSKKLAVIGDRARTRRWFFFPAETEPAPFASMKLSYARSFGGNGYPKNPVGREMPNLLSPESLYVDADSRPEPAGFGPLAFTWPQRISKAGTYGSTWKKKYWPGLPPDAEWTLFNAAPRDQQLEYLRGNETLVFENLHPAHPRLETALPGVRARWFLREEKRFREIPLHLDTLWADLDALKLVLVWRGVADVADAKMKGILDHFVISEPLGAPPRDYAALLEKTKAERSARTPKTPLPKLELADAGKPSMDWLGPFAERKSAAEKELEKAERKMRGLAKKKNLPWNVPKSTGDAPPIERIRKMLAKAPPLRPEAKAKFPALPPDLLSWNQPQIPVPQVPPLVGVPEAKPRAPKPTLDYEGQDRTGASFADAPLVGAKFAGAKLSKADFSRADLSGADFTGADLEGAVLLRADLTGATLAGAKMAGADLSGAQCGKAAMKGADLSKAKAVRAVFAEADLTGAVLREADLSIADLSKARLGGADLTGAVLQNARAAGLQAPGAKFDRANLAKFAAVQGSDLTKASLRETKGAQSVWSDARLDGADLFGAEFPRANFSGASLAGAVLSKADLRWARLSEAKLEKASLLRANLFQANLGGADLRGADLRGANLFQAELLDTKLEGAGLQDADVTGTKLG